MKKFLICILEHRNSSYTTTAFLHLVAALRENKELINDCKIVIAASSRSDIELAKIKKFYGGEFDVDIFECNPSYPEKIKAVLDAYPITEFEYFIKHDEDLFLNSNSWKDFLLLSPSKLEDTKNLLTTVNLSTGIPTWSYFASTFFPEPLIKEINEHLVHDKIPDHLWGNSYTSVNTSIKTMNTWDEEKYWEAVNALSYDYKGIHPVRTNIWYTKTINEYCIDNYTVIQEQKTAQHFIPINNRYFCNSFFMMKYATYKTIFEDRSLYSDAFDEVPINRYLQKHNLSLLLLENSSGIHIMYNSVYDQRIQWRGKTYQGNRLEEAFSFEYFTAIINLLSDINPNVKSFSFVKTPIYTRIKETVKQTKYYRRFYKKISSNIYTKKIYKIFKKII